MDLIELKNMGFDPSTIIDHLNEILDFSEEPEKSQHAHSRSYSREKRAMAATPADVKEYPNSYVFVMDMPGLKSDQIKVHIELENMLVVNGERKREKDKDVVKYIKMERRLGKYLKKFILPNNADTGKISAMYEDGVLTVTVEKKPASENKKAKTIQVNVA